MEENDVLLREFGRNLRRARREVGLTQEKLAERSGMDITNLQRIEAGKYNTKVLSLIRLRDALGIEWDDLLPQFGK
jgi:transcriptional regulator with XRE-family HTH domain